MPSKKSNSPQHQNLSNSRLRNQQQANTNRNTDSLHYRQEDESSLQGINYENNSWDNVLDLSPIWQAHQNLQNLIQLDPISIIPRLNLNEPNYQSQESKSESQSRSSNVQSSSIKRRVRSSLPAEERRRFNNMGGFLIGGLKYHAKQFLFDGLQVRDVSQSQLIKQVFEELLKVLKKLSSKNGTRKDLMMLFNKIDLIFSKQINDQIKRTKAQEIYLRIEEKYNEEIINQAKSILRIVIARYFSYNKIGLEAKRRKFKGSEEETQLKREMYYKYLLYLRKQLELSCIRAVVRKNEVLSQQSYDEQMVNEQVI